MSTLRRVVSQATHSELQKRQITSDEVFTKVVEGLEARRTKWIGKYINGNSDPLFAELELLLKEIGLSEEERRVQHDNTAMDVFLTYAAIAVREGMEELDLYSDEILVSLVQWLMYHLDEWVGAPYTPRELTVLALSMDN